MCINIYLNYLVKEHKHQRYVSILLSCRYNVQIIVFYVSKRALSSLQYRRQHALLFLLHEQGHELLDDTKVDVTPVISRYKDLWQRGSHYSHSLHCTLLLRTTPEVETFLMLSSCFEHGCLLNDSILSCLC